MNKSSIWSSSITFIPLIPLPPRFWLWKLSGVMRLIYPSLEKVIIASFLGINASSLKSSISISIEVLLSSPYLSRMRRISSRITPKRTFSSAKMASNSAIFFSSSSYSFWSFSLSKPVSARRRISTIACACAWENSKRLIKLSLASATFLEARIISITSSM